MHGPGILSALGTHAVHESRLKARTLIADGIIPPLPACALAHWAAVSAVARAASVRGLVYDFRPLAAVIAVGVNDRRATTQNSAGCGWASHHSLCAAACGSDIEPASSPVRLTKCTALAPRPTPASGNTDFSKLPHRLAEPRLPWTPGERRHRLGHRVCEGWNKRD
jgi:hypothetical protein